MRREATDVQFYRAKLRPLIANAALASTRIDAIDEAAVEEYVRARGRTESRRNLPLATGSINRELATLRRLLRLAHEWRKFSEYHASGF